MPFRIRAPCVPPFPGGRIRPPSSPHAPGSSALPGVPHTMPRAGPSPPTPRTRASRTMPTPQPGRGDAPSRTRPTGNKKGTRKNHPGSLHMAGRRSLPTDLSRPVRGRRRGEGRPRDSRNKSRPPMLARTAEIGKPLRAARRTPRQILQPGLRPNRRSVRLRKPPGHLHGTGAAGERSPAEATRFNNAYGKNRPDTRRAGFPAGGPARSPPTFPYNRRRFRDFAP